MAYNDKARELRQCTHIIERTGERCRRWATYGTPDQKCVHHRAETPPYTSPACNCKAYPFPHRRASGHCRWPDPPITRWGGWQGKRSITSPRKSDAMRDNPELYKEVMRRRQEKKS